MRKKLITDLTEFNEEKTFARLLDRACQVEELIEFTNKIRDVKPSLWNTLSDQGISLFAIIQNHHELCAIYYRSLFQDSYWENKKNKKPIDHSAYQFDADQTSVHEKIIFHVDKTLAHQDFDDQGKRYVYENINRLMRLNKTMKWITHMTTPNI